MEPIEPERLSEVIAQLPLPKSSSQASTVRKQKKVVISPLGKHLQSKAEQEANDSNHEEDKGAESCDEEGNVGSSDEDYDEGSDSDIVDESQSQSQSQINTQN